MRLLINRDEPRRIDRRVALCRRQARMAQKLLNRAEIAAGGQEMRGEAVAERMRRGGLGETEQRPQRLHPRLYDSWMKQSAARAAEEGVTGREREGAGF